MSAHAHRRIRRPIPLLLAGLCAIAAGAAQSATIPFINELHYDNAGADEGEGVELLARAGTVLEGWSLVLYNGSNGSAYDTVDLGGEITDQAEGLGTIFFDLPGLQNGPDGIALVAADTTVVQFLSYEGSFTATDGPAAGMLSIDLGVAEAADTPAGMSLQLVGRGREVGDFHWIAGAPASYGALNSDQEIAAVPLPGSLALLTTAFGGLLALRAPGAQRRKGMKLQHRARQASQSSNRGISTVSSRKLAVRVTT